MDERASGLDSVASLQGMLGYLNFSEGRPDARFQKQLNEAYSHLLKQGVPDVYQVLRHCLQEKMAELRAQGSAAFADSRQAEAALQLVWDEVLPAYRRHHSDLLFHLPNDQLFRPFFLARVCEAVLAQRAPWTETERITQGALRRLNDFVGHRPIAILETRPMDEPYDHERVGTIPLYFRGVGVECGRFHELVVRALEILEATDPAILRDACLDPSLLDELVLDPRAYDHSHPANKRPNYVFGEWDPHFIDQRGFYRRYVVRRLVLEAILDRVEQRGERSEEEALFEGAAVLTGTILMAAGVSGAGPETHDSTVTLAKLIPHIARYRDTFYATLLERAKGPHAERLRTEAAAMRQPFAGARQHLNQYLAQHRARQLQQRHMSLVLAGMGFPEASRTEAHKIPAASVRMLSEMAIRLTVGWHRIEQGDLAGAAGQLPEVEAMLRRGIACGALVDPWNVLGFQGLYPLFHSVEDSVRDNRIDELVQAVEQTLGLYARVLSEAAAAGDSSHTATWSGEMRKLAAWWDRYATVDVADVQRVHGGESAGSAEHVARALSAWKQRGQAAADLAFWRQHLDSFHSPKAFALVVDALLRNQDYRAAMALLMTWLSQAEQVPLDDGEHSFALLALRWLLGVSNQDGIDARPLVQRFFDLLEANAEEYWQVPRLELAGAPENGEEGDGEGSLYGAAYDEVTYKDSSADGNESDTLEGPGRRLEFDLEHDSERLEKRLKFQAAVARLWNVASRPVVPASTTDSEAARSFQEALQGWLTQGRGNYQRLLGLLDAIHQQIVPEPSGSVDSNVEYDRQRGIKEHLLNLTISTCLDTSLAVTAMQGASGQPMALEALKGRPPWEPVILQLEQALRRGDAEPARKMLVRFLHHFRSEPLTYTPFMNGGHPHQILRAVTAQTILRMLATNLPQLGLLRETYHLVATAHEMEKAQQLPGPRTTEFDHLFYAACRSVIEMVVHSSSHWPTDLDIDASLVRTLEKFVEPFWELWSTHSRTLRLSSLEVLLSEEEWWATRNFIRCYGGDLFTVRFLTPGNMRGVLHRGVGAYLDYLRDQAEPNGPPVRLVAEIGQEITREDAEQQLRIILLALVENYEEFKDYSATAASSDYGENLYMLLDFLRLKSSYDRHAWHLRPLAMAHEVLVRRGRLDAARIWQKKYALSARKPAVRHLQELARLEQLYGIRLRTVADHLQEQFVKPLALDRLCALVEPAVREARDRQAGPSFARIQEALAPFEEQTTGVGLDVPHWLRRLQAEVQRVRAARTPVAELAENLFRVPRRALSFEELQRQLPPWNQALLTDETQPG
jgi:hypothetical protein